MNVLFIGPYFPDVVDVYKDNKKLTEQIVSSNLRRCALELAYPAAVLEEKGHTVKIIDNNVEYLSKEDLLTEVKKFNPELIFFSTSPISRWLCPYNPEAVEELLGFLKKNVTCPIGAFGPHGTMLPAETIDVTAADFIIIGEPEYVCLNFVENQYEAKGIVYKKDGETVHNPASPAIQDLDALPFPAYHLLSMQKYNKFIMMSSRGCPAICTFCNKNAMFGQAYRYRSPANVIDELKVLISHGVKAVYFQDLEFSINQARTKEICKKLAEAKLPISWSRTTRVTSVNHEILSLMKDAGCTKILFGLETADPDVLKKSKKGITLPIVERVMDECDELGIKAGFHVIFGLPGETRKTMRNTAKFIKKHMGRENIEIDAGFTTIVYPGTELFEMAKQRNMVKGNPWKSMYSLGGIVDTEFKTHEEFLNEYAKVKRDIILHKFKLKHGSLFFLNPTFLRVGFKYIYKKAFPHFTD